MLSCLGKYSKTLFSSVYTCSSLRQLLLNKAEGHPGFKSNWQACVCPLVAVLHAGDMPQIFEGTLNPEKGSVLVSSSNSWAHFMDVMVLFCQDGSGTG